MTIDEILLRLDIDGWCVVEGVIPEDKVDAIRESVEEATISKGKSQTYTGVVSARGILGSILPFMHYLNDNRILGVAERWFGPHVRISFTNSIINMPENERGGWHADWPFNQEKPGCIPAPYPDAVMQLSALWMLSPFSADTGGTLLVPGSHRATNNPTGDIGVDRFTPYPTEMQATGSAGSVLLLDSRVWHSTAVNHGDTPRVAMVVRYAPWWLNLDVLMPGSDERARMVDEPGKSENEVPPIPKHVYDMFPEGVKPLYRHWVRE